MEKKISLCLLFVATLLAGMPKTLCAAGQEKAGPLIQTTTLQSDYEAMTSLSLANTKLLLKQDEQKAFENILCSCVRVKVEGHYGSGSIYQMTEDEIIIVTNRHVLQYYNDESYVTFYNGRVGSGKLLGISEAADVGFISIPIVGFGYEELLQYRNVRKNEEVYEKLKENDCFFMVDIASELSEPEKYSGKIVDKKRYLEDFGTEMLYGNAYAKPGMSGCGVFDCYGNYVGMLSGGTLYDEIAAVPLDVIMEEYEKIK